ncbi:hypothetical protein Tco_1438151, partial [Tanacetum coccineum]
MLSTDISKITRKPSKTGKHGHGKWKSTREAKDSKPKPEKKSSFNNSSDQEQDGKDKSVKSSSLIGSLMPCGLKEAQEMMNYTSVEPPVDVPYCRVEMCYFTKNFKEDLLTYCGENETSKDFEDISESSDDNTNIVNAPRKPIVVNQDPGKKSSQELEEIKRDQRMLKELKKRITEEQTAKENMSIEEMRHEQQLVDYRLKKSRRDFGAKLYNEERIRCRRRLLSIPFVNEDDYIPLGDIIARYSTSKAITPALSPEEPVDSLIMEDEHLDTIPETESDKFIKSSVENLVQNPSESTDISNGESECDVPINDDSPESHFTIFSNPLFDLDDDFSSDDESLSEEEIQKDKFKYYSNSLYDLDDEIFTNEKILPNQKDLDVVIPIPSGTDKRCFNAKSDLLESLLNHDSPIDSTKIDSIFDEFSLPRPPEESNSEYSDATIESLSPSPIPVEDSDPFMEEIDIFLASDDSTPPGVESVYDSEGDILLLEELLNDDLVPLAEYNHFSFDVEPDTFVKNDFDELNEDECFDPGEGENVVFLNVEEDDSFTFTICTFLPFVTYPEISPLLSSTKNENFVFDPGITTFHKPV